eukprot:TRINITY_DN3911_c0_g1_i1.p1 TRINITY_DN3911_c0_g1~~TRINITY_DN3911_c0_g1_i1.p1  ORF type:complete len:326 (+),score=100.30 TRINITY_DN3911_c0_g1_i1:575-1552(+)
MSKLLLQTKIKEILFPVLDIFLLRMHHQIGYLFGLVISLMVDEQNRKKEKLNLEFVEELKQIYSDFFRTKLLQGKARMMEDMEALILTVDWQFLVTFANISLPCSVEDEGQREGQREKRKAKDIHEQVNEKTKLLFHVICKFFVKMLRLRYNSLFSPSLIPKELQCTLFDHFLLMEDEKKQTILSSNQFFDVDLYIKDKVESFFSALFFPHTTPQKNLEFPLFSSSFFPVNQHHEYKQQKQQETGRTQHPPPQTHQPPPKQQPPQQQQKQSQPQQLQSPPEKPRRQPQPQPQRQPQHPTQKLQTSTTRKQPKTQTIPTQPPQPHK